MSSSSKARAVCLVSGGMDSAVSLFEARAAGFELCALSIRYGQRHVCELDAAARVASSAGVRDHRVVAIDLAAIGGSALTDRIEVPKDRGVAEIGRGIPPTYVPARNTIFLSVALAFAEVIGAKHIFLGVNALDYSGYPDCRPEFLRAFEALANLATVVGAESGARFELRAPLIDLSKAEIISRGLELGVDFALTHTCYDPLLDVQRGVLACGRCDACVLRLKGFRELGLRDPIAYSVAQ